MATALFLCAASTETRTLEGRDPCFTAAPEATTTLLPVPNQEPLQVAEEPKPKPKRNNKKKPSSSKKQPQRGLGVAQLEKLRLQERWKKMTEFDQVNQIHPSGGGGSALADCSGDANCDIRYGGYGSSNQPLQFQFPVYDSCGAGAAKSSAFPVAAPSVGIGYAVPWAESCFLQRHRTRTTGIVVGAGSHASVRSVFPDQQYAPMDHQYRSMAEIGGEVMRFPVGSPIIPELSSNQMMQCSENCDLCLKKHLLQLGGGERVRHIETKLTPADGAREGYNQSPFGFTSRIEEMVGEGYHGAGAGFGKSRIEVKEYEFFPSCTDCGHNGEGESAFGGRESGESSSSATAAAHPATNPSFVDLSLKLSY